jgi:hypothetical protein
METWQPIPLAPFPWEGKGGKKEREGFYPSLKLLSPSPNKLISEGSDILLFGEGDTGGEVV